MSENTIPVTIQGVYLHPNQGVPVVFLANETKTEVVSLLVGILEAQAIVLALKKISPSRPLTIDLLRNIIVDDLDASVERIVIEGVKEGTFLATIRLKDSNGNNIVRDARPSDAIALALRTRAPLELNETLLNRPEQERENTRALLELLEREAKSTENVIAAFSEDWLKSKKKEEDEDENES